MSKYLKLSIFIMFYYLTGFNALCTETDSSYFSDTSYVDTLSQQEKEFQIYLYHVKALLEYQDYQIEQYKTMIIGLIVVIAIILTLIILNFLSKKFEKSFQLIRTKKIEMVPATTLKMIFRYWKVKEPIKSIQQKIGNKEEGSLDISDITRTADGYGFECYVLKSGMKEMLETLEVPFIAIFPNHMAIVYKAKKDKVLVADAFYGYLDLKLYYFVNNWFIDKNKETGIFIALLPGKIHNKKTRKIKEKLEQLPKLEKKFWKQYNLY